MRDLIARKTRAGKVHPSGTRGAPEALGASVLVTHLADLCVRLSVSGSRCTEGHFPVYYDFSLVRRSDSFLGGISISSHTRVLPITIFIPIALINVVFFLWSKDVGRAPGCGFQTVLALKNGGV